VRAGGRVLGGLSLALAVGGVNAACINFRPAPPPIAPEAAGAAPRTVWTARIGRGITGRVALSGDTLYAGGFDRRVVAVDLRSGKRLWARRLSGIVAGGVVVSGDTLYAGTARPEGRVYALRRATGRVLWRTRTGPLAAPLTLAEKTLVAASARGEVLGVDARTGAIRWRHRLGVARSPAEPAGSAVVVATTDSLFRIEPAGGAVTARAASPGSVVSPWLNTGSRLTAGTTDSLVVAVRPDDLRVEWAVPVDAPVLESPAAQGDTLFVVSRRGTVYRIEPGAPPAARPIAALEWPVTAPPAVVEGRILLGGADGVIRALTPDGREVWRLGLWRPVELSPIALPDGLLAFGGNGDLHRYRR
jgi:outer membrane protein assembly factor BamB